ncbi:MAG TPA: FMN-binding protein [Actinomycetes bacterium]|nr:FMN-binding protein [Actinomycetes bacterium]
MSESRSLGASVSRVALILVSTVAALVLILTYRTPPINPVVAAGTSAYPQQSTGTSGSGAGSASTTTKRHSSSSGQTSSNSSGTTQTQPKTATGALVSTFYGPVQVMVSATGSNITDVTAVALPSGDPRSSSISSYAGPMLRQQALAAQSAGIDGVAGASYTSAGYRQSLQSALDQLGIKN